MLTIITNTVHIRKPPCLAKHMFLSLLTPELHSNNVLSVSGNPDTGNKQHCKAQAARVPEQRLHVKDNQFVQ